MARHAGGEQRLSIATGGTGGVYYPYGGAIARVEEVTRCLPEVQDALISLLSDRRVQVPELTGPQAVEHARPGFNVIATANLRDRGVSDCPLHRGPDWADRD